MGLKREEPQAAPRTGEHGRESLLVILGRRRDEAATAMQLNVLAEAGVHIGEKRSPWLRRLFNARHTVTARP